MVYYTEYQAHAPPLKFWQIEEEGFTATRIVRIWNVGVQKLSYWHLYCKHIENLWDCQKLLTPLEHEAHWHCQVEKVKCVLYGLRQVKRKGSGEVFPEQESLAVYRISKGSCTWQKCKGTMNWNKIWNLNRNVDRIGELYWAKMGRKYKLTFANFGK